MVKSILDGIGRFFVSLFLLIYYWLEGIVKFFIPRCLRYKDVSNEIVLITGGGSGLGRLLATRFARRGTPKIVLWDLNKAGLEESVRIVEQAAPKDQPVKVYTYTCDVSDRFAVYEVARRVKQEVGPVSILINNAGIVSGRRLLDTPDEKIIKTFEVNAIAHFWVSDPRSLPSIFPSLFIFQRSPGTVLNFKNIPEPQLGPWIVYK